MIISHSHKFIFFSNPKTGSESMRLLLQPYQEEDIRPFSEHMDETIFYPHMRPEEARLAFSRRNMDFDDYYKFLFTRNPWARMVSLYEMTQAENGSILNLKRRLLKIRGLGMANRGDFSFQRWLRSVSEKAHGGGGDPSQRWRRYGTYSLEAFAGNADGVRIVDRVIPLESAPHILPEVFCSIGLPSALGQILPQINRGRNRPYFLYYDQTARELVATRYQREIEEFNYTFN